MNRFERPDKNDPMYLVMRGIMTHPKSRTCVECGCDYPPLIHYRDELDTTGLIHAHEECSNCGRKMNAEHDMGWSMRFRDEEARMLRKARGIPEPEDNPCPHLELADRRLAALQIEYLKMPDDEKLNNPELAPRGVKQNAPLFELSARPKDPNGSPVVLPESFDKSIDLMEFYLSHDRVLTDSQVEELAKVHDSMKAKEREAQKNEHLPEHPPQPSIH